MIADYHIHTHLCGHAAGEPREYVESALHRGLDEMGFADHLPMVRSWKPTYSMRRDELDGYVTMVQELAREYASDIRILLGVEADFFAGAEDELAELLGAYPFDYTIGSVHELTDGFIFDVDENRDAIPVYGVDRVYLAYYDLMRQAAETGLFTVAGHFDLPKKFGHRPVDEAAVAAAATAALAAVSRSGAALEINTHGWADAVGEAYPGRELLALARARDVPLTFGSDAHEPAGVAARFDAAASLARDAGYAAVRRLSGGFEELPS